MKIWHKYALITLLIALPAFVLGPKLWPPSPDITPTPTQLPFFIALSAIEAIILGIGVAFMIFNWTPARPAFWAVSWLMVSWWPHDNWHIHNGLDPAGLLIIEYCFHVTLIIASLIIASDWAKKRQTKKSRT